MKPCNELEIVGLKSMQPSKDYYKGYDAAEKNYMRMLDNMKTEIQARKIVGKSIEHIYFNMALDDVLQIIDKYKGESEVEK